MTVRLRCAAVAALLATAACGAPVATLPEPAAAGTGPPPATPADHTEAAARSPILPPARALLAGLMPLHSAGVDEWRARHPTYDGRGVLIGILDTGVDPGVDGLIATSTGAPKVLDVRDFSGEGRVALAPVSPGADGTVTVAGRPLAGAGRIARLTSATTWYAGVLSELPLGPLPAADLNGDGTNRDTFPVVVVRAPDGWVAFLDTNLDGSFEDEMPLHDYRQGRETLALGTRPITLAANFGEADGAPTLDFVFDTDAHGTHVAGIAAGHDLFAVAGFDGVAPGAQLLGLKIANDARGGLSTTGSIARALAYAARFAERRNLPLVLNLSWGIGNEPGERAVLDSLVDAFLAAHPDVVLTVSAGNDGPGLSSVGLPGSADLALGVGAALPGAFAPLVEGRAVPGAGDVVEAFSARGGRFAKPDVVLPGWAFSSVPAFDAGNEIKAGTSMAAPYAAGLAACLLSALTQQGRRPSGADVVAALRASAAPLAGAGVLDQGAGVPRLARAYQWLLAGHQGARYLVRATTGGGSAAYRRAGLAGPADTLEVFRVRHAGGGRAAQFQLRSDADWLSAPPLVAAGARETEIPVRYRAARLAAPGLYVGTVTAWNPSDTLAGPLFRLVNVVAVPYDVSAGPVADDSFSAAPAAVRRAFFRVPAGATAAFTLTLPDSARERGRAVLYEPNGAPFRELGRDSLVALGGGRPGTARFLVRADEAVAGIYELDLVAPPEHGVRARLRAALAALTLADSEAANPGQPTVRARLRAALLGVERVFKVAGRGAAAESLAVRVPAWAAAATVEVAMPAEQWREFSDFGLTAFDSAGQQVARHPLDYALEQARFPVPAGLAGRLLTLELYPGFARDGGAHPWHASVRVRFLLPEPRALEGEREVAVVGGGRAPLPLGRAPELARPPGFAPLLEVRVHPVGGGAAGGVGAGDAVRWLRVEP
jgi:subtilisin family serine protease